LSSFNKPDICFAQLLRLVIDGFISSYFLYGVVCMYDRNYVSDNTAVKHIIISSKIINIMLDSALGQNYSTSLFNTFSSSRVNTTS